MGDKTQSQAEIDSEIQQARLRTIRETVRVKIDGDWDEATINTAFDQLEKALGLTEADVSEEKQVKTGRARSGSSSRRRGRGKG